MDWQTAFNVALAAAGMLCGWLMKFHASEVKDLRRANSKMEEAIQALSVKLPTDYLQKHDFKQFEDMISHKLDKIFEKLDNKADK